MDDEPMLSVGEARTIFERIAVYPDYSLYVATADQAVVGTFALLIMDNLGHLGARSRVVENVAVDPSCQGRGIGKALM